jgi:hypothetical protein
METVMQRTDAVKWFWPFMLSAVVAAATIIALPPSVLSGVEGATADEPQFRMQLTVTGASESNVADRALFAIEPYPINVTAKRAPTLLERLAGALTQRKPS